MKTLMDLLDSAEGLRFLESEGVYVTQQEFEDQLKTPIRPDLADLFGKEEAKLVCSGQQVYVDYRQSVLSKFETLRELQQDKDLFPFFLWVDTDRSGSDNLATKLAWPHASKKGPITIGPQSTRDIESRFVTLNASVLRSAVDKLGTHLRQSGESVKGAKQRYIELREIFIDESPGTLSEFNLKLTDFLLANVFGFTPHSVRLSDLLDRGILLDEVNLFVNRIADVVQVFNKAIQTLVQKGIDPQVKPLPEHYLPLFLSCEVDNKRLRFHHAIDGNDHFAVAACKCGQDYRFYLGNGTLSVAEIARTSRWSPDVCFPIFLNRLVSGFVAGKSSAIYLLVMNQVLRKALDGTPVPIFIPENLELKDNNPPQFDSLMYRYFTSS
jgi:hypothetical protein